MLPNSRVNASAVRDMTQISDEAFRLELRHWIEAVYPPNLRFLDRRPTIEEVRPWFRLLIDKGWLAPHWPRVHGGMGLEIGKYLIYYDEFARHGCARIPDHAIHLLGPLLIRYGTSEQKSYFLPRILSGEHLWCQGYSEPGAGSDLASLRTEAVLDGEDFVVNGQKIWTSLAAVADWIFLLVRTDKTVRSQAGISFLLADLRTPGITVRPIVNLKGEPEFAQVFLDDVRVPKKNLVGAINDGWTMAKSLLGDERIVLGSPRQAAYAMRRLKLLAEQTGAFDDPAFKDRYASLRLDLHGLVVSFEGYAEALKSGSSLGPDASFLKIWATELFQRATDELLELAGEQGGLADELHFGKVGVDVMNQYLEARPPTIYGGSNEIQRNILAKLMLNLPS
jgi:alkylation response protein AidB-like acyl-CoA dehydrogenase